MASRIIELEETRDAPPDEEEVREYAEFLGIDPEKEPHLMWIAREGVVAPVPHPWKACSENGDDIFYFNFETAESNWDHPLDAKYHALTAEYRAKGPGAARPGADSVPKSGTDGAVREADGVVNVGSAGAALSADEISDEDLSGEGGSESGDASTGQVRDVAPNCGIGGLTRQQRSVEADASFTHSSAGESPLTSPSERAQNASAQSGKSGKSGGRDASLSDDRSSGAGRSIEAERKHLALITQEISDESASEGSSPQGRGAATSPKGVFSPPARTGASDAQKSLTVTFRHATGLQHMNHIVGDSPYCVCRVVRADKHAKATEIKSKCGKGLQPDWSQEVILEPWTVGEKLEFCIYDKGMMGSKLEGKAVLSSERFYPQGFDGPLELSGSAHAKLYVRIAAATAASIQNSDVSSSSKTAETREPASTSPSAACGGLAGVGIAVSPARDGKAEAAVLGERSEGASSRSDSSRQASAQAASRSADVRASEHGSTSLSQSGGVAGIAPSAVRPQPAQLSSLPGGSANLSEISEDIAISEFDVSPASQRAGRMGDTLELSASGTIDEPSVLDGTPTKKLVVTIVSAKGLKAMNHLVADAFYCVCELKHSQRKAKVTRFQTSPNTSKEPYWNEKHELEPWRAGELEFTIHNKGALATKVVGYVTLKSEQFDPHGFDGELELSGMPNSRLHVIVALPAAPSSKHDAANESMESVASDRSMSGTPDSKLRVAVGAVPADAEPLPSATKEPSPSAPKKLVGTSHVGHHVRQRSMERTLRHKERQNGSDHPEVAKALIDLADHFEGAGASAAGAEDARRDALQRALKIQEQHQHPGAEKTRKRLGVEAPVPSAVERRKELVGADRVGKAYSSAAIKQRSQDRRERQDADSSFEASPPVSPSGAPAASPSGQARSPAELARWKRVERDLQSLTRTVAMLRDIREKQAEYFTLLQG